MILFYKIRQKEDYREHVGNLKNIFIEKQFSK